MCAALVALGALAVACAAPSDERTSAPRPDSPCAPRADEQPSKALLRCGEHSVAFVETTWANGTGVVIEAQGATYVVTNLHVVDPFASADVAVGGRIDVGRLPVVGTDVATDIALLGPIDAEHDATLDPLDLGDPQVDKGDDVFLVGFPGTIDADETDLTITSGLVSRTRRAEQWDQTYVQSDALIGHGQSGGPLFAATGEVIGISGLSFHDGFALALSVQDVARSVHQILEDPRTEVPLIPQGDDDPTGLATASLTEGSASIGAETADVVLLLPPSDGDRTWNFTVTAPPGELYVDAYDSIDYELLATNGVSELLAWQDLVEEAAEYGEDPAVLAEEYGMDEWIGALGEVSPGVFRVEVPADTPVELTLGSYAETPIDVSWTSDPGLWGQPEPEQVTPLLLDTEVQDVLSSSTAGRGYTVELAEGQELEIAASSPQGDISVSISPPGAADEAGGSSEGFGGFDEYGGFDDGDHFDDSGEGLYGLDVLEEYTAESAGTYEVWVESYDEFSMAYRLELRRR